jgi:hypothetical protein
MRSYLILAALLVACGGEIFAKSSPDASMPDGGASRTTLPEGGGAFPPPEDGGASDLDGSSDGDAEEAGPVDPFSPCSNARDVFYAKWGPNPDPTEGSLGTGTATYTNLNAPWQINWQLPSPLSITASELSLQISPPSGTPLGPGTYALGPGPALDVTFALDGDGCFASGTLSIAELETITNDAGMEELSSALMSFNLDCLGPVLGCIRYSSTWDAGTPLPPDGGIGDGGLLSPCQSGAYIFYVDAEGEGDGGLPDGPLMVTGEQGIWNADLTGSIYQLNVAADSEWTLVAQTSSVNVGTFEPGTYTSTGSLLLGPFLQVEAAGVGCSADPMGTFTVAEVPSKGSGLLVGFDMQCNGGRRRGCVSYGD